MSVCAVVEVGIRNWLAVSEDVCAHCVYVHVTACCVINYYENGTLSPGPYPGGVRGGSANPLF